MYIFLFYPNTKAKIGNLYDFHILFKWLSFFMHQWYRFIFDNKKKTENSSVCIWIYFDFCYFSHNRFDYDLQKQTKKTKNK